VEQLVHDTDAERGRLIPCAFALFDEVGAGKTKQCVDSAQILFTQRRIDTVVALTPGFARSTWAEADPLLGEVAKHAWDGVPNVVHEFHGNYTDLDFSDTTALHWVVSNFEFVRREERMDDLIYQLKGRRTWLIVDESWAVKGNSQQTKAVIRLRRKRADRVTILNGTPLADGKPGDLYYQFQILDPEIIGAKNRTHFRSKYCIMGGFQGKTIVDYQNLDELNRRIAPYVLSRRTRDCFDLPPMLDPIMVEARLTDATWKLYREQRDDMVTWLDDQVSVSKQAITRALRLAQITSGFLGGLEDVDQSDVGTVIPNMGQQEPTKEPVPGWLRRVSSYEDPPIHQETPTPSLAPLGKPGERPTVTREIGREKLDAFLNWLDTFPTQPDKLLVWCRFKPELIRATTELGSIYPTVLNLKGGQTPDERKAAKAALAPGSSGRACVVGNPKAGGASLNFSAANIAVYLSNGPALIERTQSIGRIERPGATQPMLIVDIVATGPKGQKTIDHHIMKSLRAKEDMARWTVAQWRQILAEE